MQVKTEHGTLSIGNQARPALTVAVSPKSPTGNYILAAVLGVVLGFILGTVTTALVGERSLLLAQHLWTRLTGTTVDDGEQVHFELMLQ